MDMKEKEGNNDGIIIVTTAGNSAPPPPPPPAAPQVPPPAANKKHRRWSLFRAALFAVRGGGGQPAAEKMKGPPIHSPAKSSHSIWRSLFCGMRPLLLQQPPQLVKHELLFHDTALPPPSPAFSDNGMTSRYASAEDLQALDKGDIKELDQGEEEEDPTIDVRAEEFIARFYEQMRLQRSGSCSNDQDD